MAKNKKTSIMDFVGILKDGKDAIESFKKAYKDSENLKLRENKNPNRPKGRGIFNVVNSPKYLVYWFMNPFTASSGEFSTIEF